jgi:hypothetical protein
LETPNQQGQEGADSTNRDLDDDTASERTDAGLGHQSSPDELPIAAQQIETGRIGHNRETAMNKPKSSSKPKFNKRNFIINMVLCTIAFVFGFPALLLIKLPINFNQRMIIIWVVLMNTILLSVSKLALNHSVITPLQLIFN